MWYARLGYTLREESDNIGVSILRTPDVLASLQTIIMVLFVYFFVNLSLTFYLIEVWTSLPKPVLASLR